MRTSVYKERPVRYGIYHYHIMSVLHHPEKKYCVRISVRTKRKQCVGAKLFHIINQGRALFGNVSARARSLFHLRNTRTHSATPADRRSH